MLPLGVTFDTAVWHMNYAFALMCAFQENGDSSREAAWRERYEYWNAVVMEARNA